MDKTTQLENRIKELEKQMEAFQQSNTIPLNVDKSFVGRGYAKLKSPPIYLVGADQGAWLNLGVPNNMAYPSAFAQVLEGDFKGFWIPLYIPPRAIV